MIDWHVPEKHKEHQLPCGCATNADEVFRVCVCGAAYTAEVMTFRVFTCYDCGSVRHEQSS
jgi:hypothetical protein